MSDHLFKAGTVEHLVELTTCSQVGGTGYRKVWVCFPCLQGVSPNLSQYHSRSIWNIHEWKKINTPNGIWLKMLICKSVYQKAKVIFLCAIEKKKRLSLPSHICLFELKMFPTWTKKTEALACGAQFQHITIESKERCQAHQSKLTRHITTIPKSTSH